MALKVKYLKFAIVKSDVIIFLLKLATNDMKHRKRFKSESLCQILWVCLVGRANAKIQLRKIAYGSAPQNKRNDACSNMVGNILPTDTPWIPGWGKKGQKVKPFFVKVVMFI